MVNRTGSALTPGAGPFPAPLIPSVLIVDDDQDMRELQRVALGCGGYQTHLAANGREALEMLTSVRPCVIVLDLMMPVMELFMSRASPLVFVPD